MKRLAMPCNTAATALEPAASSLVERAVREQINEQLGLGAGERINPAGGGRMRLMPRSLAALASLSMFSLLPGMVPTLALAYEPNLDSGTESNQTVDGPQQVHKTGSTHGNTVTGAGEQYVYDGGMATNTTVENGGKQYVSNGGVASSTTLNSDGRQDVSSGGSAGSTIINSDGMQVISNGGSAHLTAVYTGGRQIISSGGTVTETTIYSWGKQFVELGSAIGTTISGGAQEVHSGGVASSTIIESGGWQDVRDGGAAYNTTINSGWQQVLASAYDTIVNAGGTQDVQSDAASYDTIVNAGGTQKVQSNAAAYDTTITSGGEQLLYGTANSTIISNGGRQNISNNGSAVDTTVHSGGEQHVSSGGYATSSHIHDGGQQHVSSGGSAADTTVHSGGEQHVSSGGSASRTIISNGGQQYVHGRSSLADDTVIDSGGEQHLYGSGSALSTHISSGGQQHVSSGGSATWTYIHDGGQQHVSYGGHVFNTTVHSGGEQRVSSGGSALWTSIDGGGQQHVYSGGIAEGTTVNSGGALTVESGGRAVQLTQSSGGNVNVTVRGGDSTSVNGQRDVTNSFTLNNGVATNFTLYDGGWQVVESGGSATNTHISGGTQYVNDGGYAFTTTVHSGGEQRVSSGGTATGTTVNGGGWQTVYYGGTATGTTVNGGTQSVYEGGTATGTTLNLGAQFVYEGGTATGTTLNLGTQSVYEGGTATDTAVNGGGWQYIYSGGTATGTTVNSGGWQYIYSGGTATGTTVNSGGHQDVYSGGTATGTTVNSGGWQQVHGAATSTTVNDGGQQIVYSGGTAHSTTVNSGGWQYIYYGGTANGTTVNGGGTQIVNDRGTATGTTVNGGRQFVYDGATATGTTVNSGGWQQVHGAATSTTVNDGGQQIVYSGGTANQTSLNGGRQYVDNGGTADSTRVNAGGWQEVHGAATGTTVNSGGWQNLNSGGTASSTTVNGGRQFVYDGAKATGTTINSGGWQQVHGAATSTTVNDGGQQIVYSGGTANQTSLNGGRQYVDNGGTADSTRVNAGGWQAVHAGGAATGTTVNSGGQQDVYSGGLAQNTTVAQDGSVIVYSGGTLAYTSPGVIDGQALIRDDGTLNAQNIVLGQSGATLRIERNTDDILLTVLGGAGRLVKDGTATLTLNAVNSHTGANEVLQGTLKAGADEALGRGSYRVNGGAVLDIGGTAQTITGLTGSGETRIGSGSLTVDQAGSGEYHGRLSGTGSFVKDGAGTFTLYGTNDFTGNNAVLGGTLKAGADNALGRGDYFVDGGATLDLDGTAQTITGLTGSGDTKIGSGFLAVDQAGNGEYQGRLSGTGFFVKKGAGTLTLAGINAFTGASDVLGGTLQAGADNALGNGGYFVDSGATLGIGSTSQTITGLHGDGQMDTGTGRLTLDQASGSNYVYDGRFSGAGAVIKEGAGILALNNAANSAGSLDVAGGTVIVGTHAGNGATFTAANGISVHDSATLAGHGHLIGNLTIRSGGTLSPGTSYGTLRVTGDLTFDTGSFYTVEVNPFDPAEADLVINNGTAFLGGTVAHLESGGTVTDYWDPDKQWTILTASAINGAFDNATTNLAFVNPVLEYGSNAVLMGFTRNAAFADFGRTQNQRAAGRGLDSLDTSSSLLRDVINHTLIGEERALLDALSGEVHATLSGSLRRIDRSFRSDLTRHSAEMARRSALEAGASGDGMSKGHNLWFKPGGSYGRLRGDGNAAGASLYGSDLSAGYDARFGPGWLGGVALRFSDKTLDVDGRRSDADILSYMAAVYGGKEIKAGPGTVRVTLSGLYGYHDVDTERRAMVVKQKPAQSLTAGYDAHSFQLVLESAYVVPVNNFIYIEPFLGVAWNNQYVKGFRESGGNAALRKGGKSANQADTTAGVRVSVPAHEKINLNAEIGWRHLYGKTAPEAELAFREGGNPFTIRGVKENRDEAMFGLGAEVKLTDTVNFGLQYSGSVGNRGQNHGGMATFGITF